MESKKKVIITFIVLIFIVSVLYMFSDWFSKVTGYSVGQDPDVELAICLTESGAKLYGSNLCSECRVQSSLFGESAFKFVNYIDCTTTPADCASFRRVPAWYINRSIIYGVKTLNELRALSRC